jgi:hypothetical protein
VRFPAQPVEVRLQSLAQRAFESHRTVIQENGFLKVWWRKIGNAQIGALVLKPSAE